MRAYILLRNSQVPPASASRYFDIDSQALACVVVFGLS